MKNAAIYLRLGNTEEDINPGTVRETLTSNKPKDCQIVKEIFDSEDIDDPMEREEIKKLILDLKENKGKIALLCVYSSDHISKTLSKVISFYDQLKPLKIKLYLTSTKEYFNINPSKSRYFRLAKKVLPEIEQIEMLLNETKELSSRQERMNPNWKRERWKEEIPKRIKEGNFHYIKKEYFLDDDFLERLETKNRSKELKGELLNKVFIKNGLKKLDKQRGIPFLLAEIKGYKKQ